MFGIDVRVAHIDDIIDSKRAVGRAKDQRQLGTLYEVGQEWRRGEGRDPT